MHFCSGVEGYRKYANLSQGILSASLSSHKILGLCQHTSLQVDLLYKNSAPTSTSVVGNDSKARGVAGGIDST